MIPTVQRPDLSGQPDERVLEDAFHARRRGDYQDALERFLTVFYRDTTNPFVLIEAATCEGARLCYAAMREFLSEAESRADGDPLVLQMIGDAWLAYHFPDEAVAAYQKGREWDPADPALIANLLGALERANRLPEAQEILESLPPSARRVPELQPIRVALARRQRRLEKAVELAELFLKEPKIPAHLRVRMEFELARVLQALNRPEEAWKLLMIAKVAHAANPEAEFHRRLFPKHLQFLANIERTVKPAHIETWRRQAADVPPRRIAFLLGHPRSGTTVMERILDAHPEIAAASEYPVFGRCMAEVFAAQPGVEPPVLDEFVDGLDLVACRKRYWGLMEGALPHPIGSRLLLDKNPALTDGVHAVARVFPEARLVVMLRDPRDVILSCMFQDFGLTRLGVACHSLEGAVTSWEATMRHWVTLRDLLPREQWIEVRYEEFIVKPDEAMNDIVAFLGCAKPQGSASSALGHEAFIRTPTYYQIGKAVRADAAGRWKDYAVQFAPFRERLTPLMQMLGYEW